MKKFDLIIVGNGSIGLLTALQIKNKFPKKKIAILGSPNFEYSASLAAGAMHNVYCEVESNFFESKLEQSNFEIGIRSRIEWKNILNKYKLSKYITAKHTYFYLKNNGFDFEKKNFDIACNLAKKDKVLSELNKNEIEEIFCGKLNSRNFKCVKINGEFGFNPKLIIQEIITKLKKLGVQIIFHKVVQIERNNETFTIDDKFQSTKLIIAAGYGSYEISKKLFNPVPVIKGVGTAFILRHKFFKKFKSVIRTSNRGGAQCGLHIVPYNKNYSSIYVGAGNYLTKEKEPWARAETIEYLTKILKQELIPNQVIYESQMINVLGYRPKSLDNAASIGPVDDNLFYISGTYRAGLTWASFIANQAVFWLDKNKVHKLLDQYKPDRKLKSWGSIEEACNYYASSRISNLIEHGLVEKKKKYTNSKFKELYKYAKNMNLNIQKKNKYKTNFVTDPDCYSFYKS